MRGVLGMMTPANACTITYKRKREEPLAVLKKSYQTPVTALKAEYVQRLRPLICAVTVM
jgi:hypothetical protein